MGIMVVYDISCIESFQNLNSWLIEIEKNASKNVYKILVGNKCDLENQRQVTFDQGKEFADTYGMKFVETSAKLNNNVQEAFFTMTKEIITASKEKDRILSKNELEKKDKIKIDLSKKPAKMIENKKDGYKFILHI
jgi:GTPase SAR1 family protein